MATTTFTTLEQRINRVAIARVANALAQFEGVANPVACRFDNTYAIGLSQRGASGAQPSITCQTASLPANPVGKTVMVGAVLYRIAVHEPDGTGLSELLLEVAA